MITITHVNIKDTNKIDLLYRAFQYASNVPVLHYLQAVLSILNLNNFHEYLIQLSLKLGGIRQF